jgi:hypothetical protein
MATRIGALVIHGMGFQKTGFSSGLQQAVSKHLASRAGRVAWQEIHWADVLEPRENELWNWMLKAKEPDGSTLPLAWRTVREFMVHNFGDAIAYHRDQSKSSYDDIHTVISLGVGDLQAELNDPDAPIVVMAHSLGGHMMSNYIWDRQHGNSAIADTCQPIPTLAAMITFGCNIPLFSLSYPVARPITLPGKGVTGPGARAAARWLNFFDRDDVLGWPLRPLYEKNLAELDAEQAGTVALIEDREINVGSPATSWNPSAHATYWTDGDFTTPVADYLGTLLDAVDSQNSRS